MNIISIKNKISHSLYCFYKWLTDSKRFSIPVKRFVFRTNKNRNVQTTQLNMNAENEKHDHRPNTRPAVEKQTQIKEKKKNS